MNLSECDSWADVEEMILGLLPPETILDAVTEWDRVTPEETVWLDRVQAARVSLGDAPEARQSRTDGAGTHETA